MFVLLPNNLCKLTFNINFKVALNKQEYLKNSLCDMKSQEVSISTSPSKGEKCSSLHFEMKLPPSTLVCTCVPFNGENYGLPFIITTENVPLCTKQQFFYKEFYSKSER